MLAKAARTLKDLRTMLDVGLFEAAGRGAYLTAFHAAQALVFERTGKVSKTHKGVHTMFAHLLMTDPWDDAALAGFLSRAYNLKSTADYGFEIYDPRHGSKRSLLPPWPKLSSPRRNGA